MSHRLYVGTIGEGVFRSLDGGVTFRRACDGMFVECHVRALITHPHDPRLLYLGCELGLFRSIDGADNWQRVESPLNDRQVWSILIPPHDPNLILVGTCPPKLFRSEDAGRTWSEADVRMTQECPRILWNRVTSFAADSDTLWAGVEIDGLYRSRDRGHSWQAVGKGLSSRDIHALAVVPMNGRRRLLASTNNDVNVSEDDGETWRQLQIGPALPSPYYRGLAQKCGRPEMLFLGNGDFPPGSTGTVGISTDGGLTWRGASLPGPTNSTVWNFAVHSANPELMYASSVSGEVYRSHDGGVGWEKLPREFGEIRALLWTA